MNDLHVAFVDFWPEWKDEDFITPIISKYYNIIIDNKNPDIIFYSIFGHNNENYKCKKILFIAENIRQNYNPTIQQNIAIAFKSANATITFDPQTETNFQLPLWQAFILKTPKIKERLYNRLNYTEFEKWCAFLVSNPSNFIRNSAYMQLNDYKKVNSYGKLFNNDNSLQKIKSNKYWRDIKDEFFLAHNHKFMITYENTPYKYYCTEKLMDAFLVGAMPIYWGDIKISESFNENAFINANKVNMLYLVKALDTDEQMFKQMYQEPVFTDKQKEKLENNLDNFEYWLINNIKK
ncbi:glycosyltransferase family 10 [bacterium]|jgi:hypothetical protein|nr:glycosyltransferase family 10 [bacterium]